MCKEYIDGCRSIYEKKLAEYEANKNLDSLQEVLDCLKNFKPMLKNKPGYEAEYESLVAKHKNLNTQKANFIRSKKPKIDIESIKDEILNAIKSLDIKGSNISTDNPTNISIDKEAISEIVKEEIHSALKEYENKEMDAITTHLEYLVSTIDVLKREHDILISQNKFLMEEIKSLKESKKVKVVKTESKPIEKPKKEPVTQDQVTITIDDILAGIDSEVSEKKEPTPTTPKDELVELAVAAVKDENKPIVGSEEWRRQGLAELEELLHGPSKGGKQNVKL